METIEQEPSKRKRRVPLHIKILIGLALGALAGGIAQAYLGPDNPDLIWFITNVTQPLGQLFLRLIFMMVVPLVVSALILGVSEMGEASKVGRIGLKCLLMTVLLSGIAVIIAFAAVNIVQPGAGVDQSRVETLMEVYQGQAQAVEETVAETQKPFTQTVVEIVPRNPFLEATRALEGGILPLMFFSLLVGIAMIGLPAEKMLPLKRLLEAIFEVSMKIIGYAMTFAPIGVFALIFTSASLLGLDAVTALGKYFFLVLLALAIHFLVVYSLTLKYIAKRNPWRFYKNSTEVLVTAFATSSSNATLPTALRVSRDKLSIPEKIGNFVLTLGATANQNGTALFEGITVLFLAQFFGVELTFVQQLGILGWCILAGVGTAGVPGGAWPMIAIILGTIGVPPEAIAICLGIDRLLDMSRTMLNVQGDIVIAASVATMEGYKPGEGKPGPVPEYASG
jgi:DAACS family dicarboxylate/amino acid:cation (Na+ or H+) symporter